MSFVYETTSTYHGREGRRFEREARRIMKNMDCDIVIQSDCLSPKMFRQLFLGEQVTEDELKDTEL